MPRTQSPKTASGGLRKSLLARSVLPLMLLAGIATLALGWTALSSTGSGGKEARAQVSGQDSAADRELAQAQPPDDDRDASGGAGEEDYAAFGNRENPFDPVVEFASEDDGDAGEGGGGSGNGGDGGVEDSTGDGGENTSTGGVGDPDVEPTPSGDITGQPPRNGDANGDGSANGDGDIVIGPNGERVDCGNPVDEFEFVICEEELGEEPDSATPGTAPQGGQPQGVPGSGGSGRSGAGETADDFRNGGGGALK